MGRDVINNDIIITTKMVDEFTKTSKKITKRISGMGTALQKTKTEIVKTDKAGNKFKTTYNETTKGMRKFQMEQLGVMFGGMALNRAMSNLSSTAREWVGMNELMSIAMGQLMLPTTLDLLNLGVLPLFDALTNLPEGAQKAIGILSLALEGLGGLMMVGGQLMLGLDSTTTLLSKWAQINPNKVFTAKGLEKIGDKLKGSLGTLKKIGKFAAAGILMSIAIEDLTDGQVIAAVGGTAMAAGVIMGKKAGGAVFAVGAVLKLVGDEQFLIDTIKTMFKVGETINSILKEAVISGFTPGKGFNIENIEGLADRKDAFNIAAEQISMENALKGIGDSVIEPTTQLNRLGEETNELFKDLEDGLISYDKWSSKTDLIAGKMRDLIKQFEIATKRVDEFNNSTENINKIATEERRTNVARKGLLENVLFPGIAGSFKDIFNAGGQGSSEKNVVINQNLNISGVGVGDVKDIIKKENQKVVADLNRQWSIK